LDFFNLLEMWVVCNALPILSLLEANNFVMQKRILSGQEHYDFPRRKGNQLGAANGNIVQIPPKFVVVDTHGAYAYER